MGAFEFGVNRRAAVVHELAVVLVQSEAHPIRGLEAELVGEDFVREPGEGNFERGRVVRPCGQRGGNGQGRRIAGWGATGFSWGSGTAEKSQLIRNEGGARMKCSRHPGTSPPVARSRLLHAARSVNVLFSRKGTAATMRTGSSRDQPFFSGARGSSSLLRRAFRFVSIAVYRATARGKALTLTSEFRSFHAVRSDMKKGQVQHAHPKSQTPHLQRLFPWDTPVLRLSLWFLPSAFCLLLFFVRNPSMPVPCRPRC